MPTAATAPAPCMIRVDRISAASPRSDRIGVAFVTAAGSSWTPIVMRLPAGMPSGWEKVTVSPEVTAREHSSVERGGPTKHVAAWTPPGTVTSTVADRIAPIVEPVTSQYSSGTPVDSGVRSAPRTS